MAQLTVNLPRPLWRDTPLHHSLAKGRGTETTFLCCCHGNISFSLKPSDHILAVQEKVGVALALLIAES